MTRPQFARYYLMRLGIGDDLQRVALDPKHPHRLASRGEVRVSFCPLFHSLTATIMKILLPFLTLQLIGVQLLRLLIQSFTQ